MADFFTAVWIALVIVTVCSFITAIVFAWFRVRSIRRERIHRHGEVENGDVEIQAPPYNVAVHAEPVVLAADFNTNKYNGERVNLITDNLTPELDADMAINATPMESPVEGSSNKPEVPTKEDSRSAYRDITDYQ